MPTLMQLSEETKAFIQARLGPAGATPQECSQRLAEALAAPESTVFYDVARFPVSLTATSVEKE